MGATVVTGKSVSAFRAVNGEVIYVLFEESYEKNCYPHTPSWSCLAIGRIESVIKRIFAGAAACEGGSLQVRGGGGTPEGYIRGWLSALRNPQSFHGADRSVQLKVSESFSATIPSESADKAFAALGAIGRKDIADRLRAGETVPVKLDEDVDIVDALYGASSGLGAWRIISEHRSRGTATAEGLGYAPGKATGFDIQEPEAMRFDEHQYLLKREDGTWYCGGWAYSIVGSYVRGLAESELREPGSYNKRIKAYRAAILEAPQVPPGMKAVVDEGVALENKFARREVTRFAETYPVRRTVTGYEVEIDGIRQDPTAMYTLANLPAECITWVMASVEGVPDAPKQQGELFAA